MTEHFHLDPSFKTVAAAVAREAAVQGHLHGLPFAHDFFKPSSSDIETYVQLELNATCDSYATWHRLGSRHHGTACTGRGTCTTVGTRPIQVLYMDVGCWTGDGHQGWPKHREFGVVYGRIAILCAFHVPPHYHGQATKWSEFKGGGSLTIDLTATTYVEWPRVEVLLNYLASNNKTIGELHVLAAVALNSKVIAPKSDPPGSSAGEPIYVIIGDLHAQVADDAAQVGKPTFPPAPSPPQYPLWGRLNLDQAAPHNPRKRTTMIDGIVETALPDWLADEVFTDMQLNARNEMKFQKEWLTKYYVKGGKGAQIFQDAGQDLRALVDSLRDYQEKHISLKGCPLYVVQVGDLFDLWLGFQRGFKKGGGLHDLLQGAHQFAEFWVERTLLHETQDVDLVHLLGLSTVPGLETTFLYGNHDNYRKYAAKAIKVPNKNKYGKYAGKELDVFGAPASLPVTGLWIEHGHACDPSNRDESPSDGYGLTQVAYWVQLARQFEGFASWASSILHTASDDEMPRVVAIRHAISRCLPDRGIFVQGHSHEPLLKRIEVLPPPGPPTTPVINANTPPGPPNLPPGGPPKNTGQ